MKKIATLGSFIFLLIAFLQPNTFAQDASGVQEGDFKLGAGLAFGSGVGMGGDFDNDLGLRADGYYAVTPEIRVGGDFTFYLPKSEDQEDPFSGESVSQTVTVWELNLNGHYIFLDEDGLVLYGLGGLNITGFSSKYESGGDSESDSDSEVGLNLGAGVEYGLDFGDLFGELKLSNLGGDADQFVLGAGVRFDI